MIDFPVLDEKAEDRYHKPHRATKPTFAFNVLLPLNIEDHTFVVEAPCPSRVDCFPCELSEWVAVEMTLLRNEDSVAPSSNL